VAKFFGANILAYTKDMSEPEWLKVRMNGVGGSDVGSIAGVSPWGTPLSVYLSKDETCTVDKKVGRAAQWGKWMEDDVARDAAARLGFDSRRVNAVLQHPERPWMLANIDRFIYEPFKAIHEIKVIVSRERAGEIIKSVEDGKPTPLPEHEAQVRWYMAVTGIDKAIITYEMAYADPIDITIERDLEIEAHLIQICESFWQLVQDKTPPAMDGSDLADAWLQSRFKGSTPTTISLDAGASFLIESYVRARDIIKQQESIMSMAKQNLEQLMGDNETGSTPDSRVITWKPQTTNRFDTTTFKKDHPQLAEVYTKATTSRVFRVK
jgi:putative phage-type endonuclease